MIDEACRYQIADFTLGTLSDREVFPLLVFCKTLSAPDLLFGKLASLHIIAGAERLE